MRKILKIQSNSATKMYEQNVKYNLAAGDPNLDIPVAVFDNFNTTLNHQYSPVQGFDWFRSFLYPEHPERVVIGNGAKQLIYLCLMALHTSADDQVAIIGPAWKSYNDICESLGISCFNIIGSEINNYTPTFEQLDKELKQATIVLINNPNNPTGEVYSEDYLEYIQRICLQDEKWIISDDVYANLTNSPIYKLIGNNVIHINSYSKDYNLSGWRLGYAICYEELAKTIGVLQGKLLGPPNTLLQQLLYKIEFTPQYTDYLERINLLCTLPKFKKYKPAAGFYFYLPIDDQWQSEDALLDFLLTKNIAVSKGSDYGVPRTVRVSVATINIEQLSEILDILVLI